MWHVSLNSGYILVSKISNVLKFDEYLHLLWPQSLCDLIVVETNRYARLRKKCHLVDVG